MSERGREGGREERGGKGEKETKRERVPTFMMCCPKSMAVLVHSCHDSL